MVADAQVETVEQYRERMNAWSSTVVAAHQGNSLRWVTQVCHRTRAPLAHCMNVLSALSSADGYLTPLAELVFSKAAAIAREFEALLDGVHWADVFHEAGSSAEPSQISAVIVLLSLANAQRAACTSMCLHRLFRFYG